MSKYYKIVCSNGFCGCDEEFYEEVKNDYNIAEYANDILFNEYSFAEPDERFINRESWDEEITEEKYEEYEEYKENLTVNWEEITKEEYEENC